MLEAETRRRIDTARDILVGKVPDPKSQVEQITIALIYKFMDDMDKESISMGGNPSFFVGEYEKYSWTKIFNPRLGGYEMLSLYSEAITRLSQNPNLPPLFRDIFKNAYLPYRDPETLKLFLKTINEFLYDHSERLGDAYEYLLAILGSQGDAGQFLTPRHIINFMVQVVNPKKDETILDPACGTAGFLISAYRHILQANTDKAPGDLFTIDERKRLANNIKGYDIAPDMVRLSLVNMYLHGFTNPQISEYDTLTSEDKWGEYADVILANPPFMTPKGGIKPHKRFSVQSNRSEVLFIDYIAEHLTPKGRAAVIVPEGVIFQSGKAYKQLRKELIEKYLWAVVSLPAGVFNPYSGVKTSILFMDKQLAKKSDSILFMKINNDGYGLGAQRKEIDKNDLPETIGELIKFSQAVSSGSMSAYSLEGSSVDPLLVKKDALAKSGEYNLSAERYGRNKLNRSQNLPVVKIGDIVTFHRGVTYSKEDEVSIEEGTVVLRASNIDLETGKLIFIDLRKVSPKLIFKKDQIIRKDDIFICTASGSAEHIGKVAISEFDTHFYAGGFMGIIRAREPVIPQYLFRILSHNNFRDYIRKLTVGTNIRNLSFSSIAEFSIPLPTLEVQREIVAEIEEYQRIIDGARQVIDTWKPRIDVDPEWPLVELRTVAEISSGLWTGNSGELKEVRVIRNTEFSRNGELKYENARLLHVETRKLIAKTLQIGDILLEKSGGSEKQPVGRVAYFDSTGEYSYSNFLARIRVISENVLPRFLWLALLSLYYEGYTVPLQKQTSGIRNLDISEYMKTKISIPVRTEQEMIISNLYEQSNAIHANERLITIYREKIISIISRLFDKR